MIPDLFRYNAPETHQSKNSFDPTKADIFSSACVLFLMVIQSQPFLSASENDPYYSQFCSSKQSFWQIYSCLYEPSDDLKGIQSFDLDLIERMMETDPEKRLTIEEIKEHQWMQNGRPTIEEIKEEIMPYLSSSSKELAEKIAKKHQRKHQINKKNCQENTPKRLASPSTILEEYQNKVESLNNKIRSSQNMEKPSSEKRNSDAYLYSHEPFSKRKVSKDDMDINYYSHMKISSSSSDSDCKDCN